MIIVLLLIIIVLIIVVVVIIIIIMMMIVLIMIIQIIIMMMMTILRDISYDLTLLTQYASFPAGKPGSIGGSLRNGSFMEVTASILGIYSAFIH